MSKLSAKLETEWKFMDWDRLIDAIYLMIKEVKKVEDRNAELELSLDMYDELKRIETDRLNKEIERLNIENAKQRSKIAEYEGEI